MEQFRHDMRDQVFRLVPHQASRPPFSFVENSESSFFLEQEEREKMVKERKEKEKSRTLHFLFVRPIVRV